MSASETTPITVPSSSSTGNALTRYSRSRAAISLNEAVFRTEIGWADMTSWTTAFIVIQPRLTQFFPPVSLVRGTAVQAGSLVLAAQEEGQDHWANQEG